MVTRRLKVLLIAPSCGSDGIGEAWSSFQWVSGLAKRHNVTLLTTADGPSPSRDADFRDLKVVECPKLRLFEKWERFNAMAKPGYVKFYFHARRWLMSRLQSGESFDLVHQISPLALRYPSPATGLPVPLVIGPLGGSLDTPPGFSRDFGKSPWYTQLRRMDMWRLRHDHMLRRTYASAACIVAVAPYVKDLLPGLPGEFELMSETGVTQLPAPQLGAKAKGVHGMRLLFVGRVIRSKGVRDAVRAIAKLADIQGLSLDVVGDGDDLSACKDEAQVLGVADRVSFHGRRPRNEVDRFYASSDAFLFPSFREPSGNVVLEAMSYGLPMIVADRGGPGFVVNESCGFRVRVLNPDQFASDIAACIRKLTQNPELIESMGAAARERIRRDFLWDAKIARMTQVYYRVLAKWEGCREESQKLHQPQNRGAEGSIVGA